MGHSTHGGLGAVLTGSSGALGGLEDIAQTWGTKEDLLAHLSWDPKMRRSLVEEERGGSEGLGQGKSAQGTDRNMRCPESRV